MNDLDLWSLTLNICSVSPVTWWNSAKFERSRGIRSGVIAIWLWPSTSVKWIIFMQFSLLQLNRGWIIAFLMLIRYVTLWPWLWPLDLERLQHFECHAFQLCTKCKRNQIIHGWVIGDLARFCLAILGALSPSGSQQLYQTWQRHRAIIPTQEICFGFQISFCIVGAVLGDAWTQLNQHSVTGRFLSPLHALGMLLRTQWHLQSAPTLPTFKDTPIPL